MIEKAARAIGHVLVTERQGSAVAVARPNRKHEGRLLKSIIQADALTSRVTLP